MTRPGRPPLRMTHRRKQVLSELEAAASDGRRISLASLARRCGLYDYREARRVLDDLKRMGRVRD